MYQKAAQLLSQLPQEFKGDLLPAVRKAFLMEEKTVVVFDDDPTGTQTCYDVVVLTSWTLPILIRELKKKPSILFILTNSRSFSKDDAITLNIEIGSNLREAVKQTGRQVIVISRSDSTLRGHFPHEVEAIANTLQLSHAVWILIPAFIEGGRITINDVHYIVEQGELVPVSDTPFAKDNVFGYRHSNLKDWVEEKSEGKFKASQTVSCSLEDLRIGGPEIVARKLASCKPSSVVIANAASFKDLEVLAMAVIKAERLGQKFLYRSSATFVSIRAGLTPGKILHSLNKSVLGANGSLIIVGSYVPKTTSQLEFLLEKKKHETIEVDVLELFDNSAKKKSDEIIKQTDQWLVKGKDVVIYTSRGLKTGSDAESNLIIQRAVSAFLVDIVKGLTVRPSFVLAKGGITSSDLASKGLASESAVVLGQAIAGVPVWRLDSKSKFPEITYIVFPGNVGDPMALYNVWNKFKSPA